MNSHFLPNRQPPRKAPAPLIDPVNKLVLFWMHRCGSTTGQLWFFEIAGWADRMRGRSASELASMWFAEHREVYTNREQYYRDSSFLKIAIVRHPLLRAVSSFAVVIDTKSSAQWRAIARSVRNPDSNRRLSFSEFIAFLESTNLATANYHWRLQTAQDWYEYPIPDTQLVRLEAIQAGLDEACRKLGRRPIPLQVNSAQSKIDADISRFDLMNFKRDDFAREFGHDRRGIIRFPPYACFLRPDPVRRLAKLYERDLATLRYSPDSIACGSDGRPSRSHVPAVNNGIPD